MLYRQKIDIVLNKNYKIQLSYHYYSITLYRFLNKQVPTPDCFSNAELGIIDILNKFMKALPSLIALLGLGAMCLTSCTEPKPLEIRFAGQEVVSTNSFGLSTTLRSWDETSTIKVSGPKTVIDDYEMRTGKRLHCHNEAQEYVYTLTNANGDKLMVDYREYPDGFAFRYRLPNVLDGELLISEATAYSLPTGAKRWIPKFAHDSNYEQMFPMSTDGTSTAMGRGWRPNEWGYPSLVEVAPEKYMLLTETDMLRDHCGSYLKNSDENRDFYKVELAEDSMKLVANNAGEWTSLWRVAIAGSLSDVVESTLVTDLATPNKLGDTPWVESAPASWIYWAYNHGSQEYDLLCQYVDLAKAMGWPYTLVDAEWDEMRGGNIEGVAEYAKANGIKPLLWYNSTTGWINGAPGPQYRINTPEDREREFSWLEKTGFVGAKVDFFRDDKSEQMNYYIDILEDAARHKLMMNFHGGTLPRGWQRTYPNLVSMESVYGAEWYNNVPFFTPLAAAHNATLPFTRNVIGSMDYTPGTFTDSQHPHITTHGHELALTVLFESGIQHMPDRPSAYLEMPEEVKNVLMSLPTAWDESLLLAGFPGEYAVMARCRNGKWYVAGINGTDEAKDITFSLSRLQNCPSTGLLIGDGETQLSFNIQNGVEATETMTVPCAARGGFLLVL